MRLKLIITLFFCSFMVSPAYAQNFALDFGEVDEFKFVEVGGDSRFDTDEITVGAWIKPTSLPTGHYIYEGRSTIIWNGNQASGRDPYIFYINEYGALEAHVDFDSGSPGMFIIDTTPVSLNEWHHVALTIDASDIKLFLDGVVTEELNHNSGPAVKGYSHVAIGRHRHYKNPFGGLMDEVRIWDRALTEQEIKFYMRAELSGDESGLVALWKFNEGTGQLVGDSTPNYIDGNLGLNTGVESSDPSWVISDRPAIPPTIDDILTFFDQSVEDGTLEGRGRGWIAELKLGLMRLLLEIAGEFIEGDQVNAACAMLRSSYKRCDGEPRPRDFVEGDATEELAGMIEDLRECLGCKSASRWRRT